MAEKRCLSPDLSGAAGEFLVAGEITRRGMRASLTAPCTPRVDIVVARPDSGVAATVQVKTNRGRKRVWLLNKKAEKAVGERFFYVFVNLHGVESSATYHVVPSSVVAAQCRKTHSDRLRGKRPDGGKPTATKLRKFHDKNGEWLEQWDQLTKATEGEAPPPNAQTPTGSPR